MLYTYCIVYSVYRVFSHTLHLPAYTYNHIHTCVYIGMSRNHTGRLLASYSHDNRVRFWDLSMFVDDDGGEEEGEEVGEGHNSDLKPAAFSEEVDGEEAAMIADEEESGGEGEEEGAWEDMDSELDAGEEEVEEEEEDERSSDSNNNDNRNLDIGGGDDSESDDSDSDHNGNNIKGKKGNNKRNKYQNATENFYADL